MCGRFTLSSNLADLKNEFSNNLSGNFPAKYNISPAQTSAVIFFNRKQYKFLNIEWGFKTFKNGNLIINARSETVNKKKSFQKLVKFQRCLVPANTSVCRGFGPYGASGPARFVYRNFQLLHDDRVREGRRSCQDAQHLIG